MDVYNELGVRTIINAKGPATRLSGGPMGAEVVAAMGEASQACVDMAELQARASKIIASHTGAEAGLVTSGAAAGLMLGTAACVTGLDIAKMARLPNLMGMKNEVVMVRSQRNLYDHAVRAAGVNIVEVGLPDRYAGAGVRDAETWEIEAAIGGKTAAVFYVADPAARPTLDAVVKTAHGLGVPVLVDAAAQLPPVTNLRRFVDEGADLVAFSGGKALGGPQGSGMLAGRHELIMSAALQMLDFDIDWEQWTPPVGLIEKGILKGVPQHGIGRPCKIGKETVVGFLVALRLFAEDDPEKRYARWLSRIEKIAMGLADLNTLKLTIRGDNTADPVPRLLLSVQPEARLDAQALVTELQNGTPSVNVDPTQVDRGIVTIDPTCLQDHEVNTVAARVRALLSV